jgi:hypothetical protein
MKRQPYRQHDPPEAKVMALNMESMQKMVDIIQKEIEVFEDRQYADIGYDAHDEKLLSPRSFAFLNIYPRYIIYSDGKEQDQDIGWIESTIENTTCYKQ